MCADTDFKYDSKRYDVHLMKRGKQGMVGVMHDTKRNHARVYKFSSSMTMIGTHEYKIIRSLHKIAQSLCPAFLKECELLTSVAIDPDFEHAPNPFDVYPIKRKNILRLDTCMMEYVDSSKKLTSFVSHPEHVHESIIASLSLQVLINVLIANAYNKFTDYDLHSENILVQKCSYDTVYAWYDSTLNEPYVVPSLGYRPRIIDYGFAYTTAVDGESITSPIDFAKEGYLSYGPDTFADFRVFLVSMLNELHHFRGNSNLFRAQRKVVQTLFGEMNIDWESGWMTDRKACAVKFLYEATEKYAQSVFESPTMADHFYVLLDLIQTMIELPITVDPCADKTMDDLALEFSASVREFNKHFSKLEHLYEKNMDDEDSYEENSTMGLYMVRVSVLFARTHRKTYEPSKSPDIIRKFKNYLFDAIRDTNAKFFVPKINFEKYLVSILMMADILQSLLYREIKYRSSYLASQYATVPVPSSRHILQILYRYYKIPYHYSMNTQLHFMNEAKCVMNIYKFKNEDSCTLMNKCMNLAQAARLLFQLLQDDELVLVSPGSTPPTENSPDRSIAMSTWSTSGDSESGTSDDEEYDVKYSWTPVNAPSSPAAAKQSYDFNTVIADAELGGYKKRTSPIYVRSV